MDHFSDRRSQISAATEPHLSALSGRLGAVVRHDHVMEFVPLTARPTTELIRSVEELAGDARVVVLGEELHGDGATFVAKAHLARVLFEHCGFDTMGWESPIYDVRAMNELNSDADLDSVAGRGLFAIWHGQEIEPLLEFCRSRGIEHAGVDCQFLNDASRESVAADIAGWSQECGAPLEALAIQRFITGEDASVQPQLEHLSEILDRRPDSWPSIAVRNVLANRRQEQIGAPVYGPYLEAGHRGEVVALDPHDPVLIACNSARDDAMGLNAVDLVERGRKVVLWAANYHALRSLSTIEPYASRSPDVRTMGDYIHDHLGTEAKVVVGTSLTGSRWDFDQWVETGIDERLPDSSEHDWPTGEIAQLALVGANDLLPGPVHLAGVGPMRISRPIRHFDAILHVGVQRTPSYTRW